MALDGISASYAALFASMRSKAGNTDTAGSADFATFLPDEVARAARATAAPTQSSMISRILLVGVVRYAEEQKKVERVMWVLSLVRLECDEEVQAELDKIIQDFKQDPPVNGDDALDRIKEHIDAMPTGDLKLRMLKVLERIKELMALPDQALEKLENDARAKKMDAASSTFDAGASATA